MIKKDLLIKCCVFLQLFLMIPYAQAQYQYDDQEAPNYSLADQTKSDLMTIMAAGLGGAVLGLSTLSFVNDPGDHFDNVLTGAAIGLIIGVVYIAYRQAYGPTGIFTLNEYEQKPLANKINTQDFLVAENRKPVLPKDLSLFQWTWHF